MADKELTFKEIWDTLYKVDVSKHTEEKIGLTYLSWARAWMLLMEHYPQAEYAFIDYIIEIIKGKKINVVKARYIKTQKNEQVKEFFEKCSFSLAESTDSVKNYILEINNYKYKQIDYIEVISG